MRAFSLVLRHESAVTSFRPRRLAISLAAGAALDAADSVLSGAARLAYCLVRPPGHHASRASNDGYCHINNCAVAANRAAAAGHRVAIIDFDTHHGNGTQSIFYDRPDVLCVSLHMNHGAWDEGLHHPETGSASEVGRGAGVGFNVNVPLDMGTGDSGYLHAFRELVLPEVDAFRPTFIVVACGVDGSMMDPNGRQLLTTAGFFELGRACRKLADKHASGRVVITQEGGYAVSYAALCVHAVLAVRWGAPVRRARPPHLLHPRRASPACRTPASRTRWPAPVRAPWKLALRCALTPARCCADPDPPLHDPSNERVVALISRLREERASALALARAG